MVERPALADVLAAIAPEDVTRARIEAACFRVMIFEWKVYAPAECGYSGWCHRIVHPAAALEVLAERGLWPFPVDGDGAARLWCERCDGSGSIDLGGIDEAYREADFCDACCVEDPNATGGVSAWGWTASPSSIRQIASIAALGAPALLRAASLVDVIMPKAPPIWRAMGREAIDKAADTVMTAVILPGIDMNTGRATYWALREMGVPLVSCNPGRIVLGVEALS